MVHEVVTEVSATAPGNASAMVTSLMRVKALWSADWVTSAMGGGGGTVAFAEDDAIFLWWSSLGRAWDAKAEWTDMAGR